MMQARTRETSCTRWLFSVTLLGACLVMAACSDGDTAREPVQTRPSPAPSPPVPPADAAAGAAAASDIARPPPRPSPASGGIAAGLQHQSLMSTSGPDATAGQVWGEVIGNNVGVAQSCGASESDVATYLEEVQWQVAWLGGSGPPDVYLQAYEQAREKAASVVREQDECGEVLAALDR